MKLVCGLITKNEERDLPRCLKSIESIIDEVVIIDTGSTDKTIEVAQHCINKPVYVRTFTDASRKDDKEDWKLWDFSRARNQFVDEIEKRKADYLLWMDADDELLTPNELREGLDHHQVYGVTLNQLGHKWIQYRAWKCGLGIKFMGKCHEVPIIDGKTQKIMHNVVVRHDPTPGLSESSNARNLRILLEEYREHRSPRTAFYLANTHKDASRWPESIEWYAKRISAGEHYRDEMLFAYLYKARSERASGKLAEAERTLLEALSKQPDWSEYWMELGYMAFEHGLFFKAIGLSLLSLNDKIPETLLWREPDKYNAEPTKVIAWSYAHLGDYKAALAWAVRAREWISSLQWEMEITKLRQAAGL